MLRFGGGGDTCPRRATAFTGAASKFCSSSSLSPPSPLSSPSEPDRLFSKMMLGNDDALFSEPKSSRSILNKPLFVTSWSVGTDVLLASVSVSESEEVAL